MGANSKIEWCDHTFNAVVGCTKVSAACDHCYAESWAKRSGHPELWAGERRRTSEANWKQPLKWNREAADAGRRARVFCCSLADVFDNQWEPEWRADLWRLIFCTPNLDWLLLTKRPQNIAKMLPAEKMDAIQSQSWPWPNVWLGMTAEDQAEFNRRWPYLAAIPAAVRFVSYEPALAPLRMYQSPSVPLPMPFPDWIICGGESGGRSRYMEPQWARDLRDDCAHLNIAFFQKQMTRKAPIPADLLVRQFPDSLP